MSSHNTAQLKTTFMHILTASQLLRLFSKNQFGDLKKICFICSTLVMAMLLRIVKEQVSEKLRTPASSSTQTDH